MEDAIKRDLLKGFEEKSFPESVKRFLYGEDMLTEDESAEVDKFCVQLAEATDFMAKPKEEVTMNDEQKKELLSKFEEASFPEAVLKFVGEEKLTAEESEAVDKFCNRLAEIEKEKK